MSQTRLTVPEMTCEMCTATVEGALNALPGVASVTVDLETKHVTVEHNDSLVPAAQLAGAVDQQGYEVTATEAP